MILHYFHADDCKNCQQLAKYGVKKRVRRLVAGVHRISWSPMPNEMIHKTIRTDDSGQAYWDKTFGNVDAQILFDRVDFDPYTPLFILDDGDRTWEIDVLAVVCADVNPSKEEARNALRYDVNLSARLLTREIFRCYMESIGVSEENRGYAMREKIEDYPFLIPEYEEGEFKIAEWQRSFDQAVNMVYQ